MGVEFSPSVFGGSVHRRSELAGGHSDLSGDFCSHAGQVVINPQVSVLADSFPRTSISLFAFLTSHLCLESNFAASSFSFEKSDAVEHFGVQRRAKSSCDFQS